MASNIPPLSYFYKNKIHLAERGKGRFKEGDEVSWSKHIGKVVEVIPYGMYPTLHPRLHIKGYYREHESYVVEDNNGKRWWPRVGCLTLLEENI